MPNPKDDLKERLTRYRPIKISLMGRKSGRTISIPVWFVLDGQKLYPQPVLTESALIRFAEPRCEHS